MRGLSGGPDQSSWSRLVRGVVVLVLLAVILCLVGGAVPGIEYGVTYGTIAPGLSPEPYLGPPYAFSLSGRWAAVGALVWSGIAVAGLIALRVHPRASVALLAVATLLTLLVNVGLPILQPDIGWSVLGVVQSLAVISGLVLLQVSRVRRKSHTAH